MTILITGATGGIGRDAAVHLAARGHRVFASGRSEEKLAALHGRHPALETLRLDVTDATSIEETRREIEERTEGRGLDALVNNAGYGQIGALEEVDGALLRAQFETNVFGLMEVTRAFLPRMRERGSGRIVNISSVAGHVAFPLFGAYNASKFAVEALSDALRREMGMFGIHVVLIEPGPIRTEFNERARASAREQLGREDSPYTPMLRRLDESRGKIDRMAASTDCVVRAIDRALHARRPKPRSMVPFRDRVMIGLMKAMPTRLIDFAVARAMGFRR